VAARVALSAGLALLVAACGGTLVDHGGTGILGDASTCGNGQVICGGQCVAQSPDACGASCSICGAAPDNSTEVCTPVGAGGHDGVCGFQCADGLLRCASVLGGAVDGCCAPALVASGFDFTCASSTAGEVHCFGAGDLGQLGNGSTLDRATSTTLRGFTSPVSALAAGDGHACAISGAVTKCWGDGPAFGALGTVTDPQDVPSLANATKIAAGTQHTCAVKLNGDVVCVGEGAIAGGGVQSAAALGGSALDVVSSDGFTCALVNTGAVKCWGNNAFGQLGDAVGGIPPEGASTIAVTVPIPSSTIQKISAGSRHACAAGSTNGQELYCWGSNGSLQLGQLGTGIQAPTYFPDSALHKPVDSVAAGGHATCAVVNDGTYRPYCWSSDPLVAGKATPTTTQTLDGKPNALPTSTGTVRPVFSSGASHTCYVDASQTPPRLSCFGLGARGRLGNGSIVDSATPVLVIDR
jgi:hypothetical protein